jgi:hypothetical protein
VLLTFPHFNEMHTGENLARAVFLLLAEFGVTGILSVRMTDRGKLYPGPSRNGVRVSGDKFMIFGL